MIPVGRRFQRPFGLRELRYHWEIVSCETVRRDSGPTAVSSKFRWLLSGPLRDSMTSDTFTSSLIISGDCPFALHENDELRKTSRESGKQSLSEFEKRKKIFPRQRYNLSV